MISELPGGVGAGGRLPFGLLCRESVDGGADGRKPVCLAVRGAEFVEKRAAQCGGRLLGLGLTDKAEENGN
jgi:hypothetical protein